MLARTLELLRAMSQVRRRGFSMVLRAIIDIVRERSTMLIEGQAPALESGN